MSDEFLLRRSVQMVEEDPEAAKAAFHAAAVRYDESMRGPFGAIPKSERDLIDPCTRCGRRHRTLTSCQSTPEYRAKRRAYHQRPEVKQRRQAYAKHPTPAMVAAKLKQRSKEFGYKITVEERDERLDAQGHRCAICRRPFRTPVWHLVCTFTQKLAGRRIPRAMVDHDHETGLTRGLLCNWCNRTIMPLFDKHPDVMVRARRYSIAKGWAPL